MSNYRQQATEAKIQQVFRAMILTKNADEITVKAITDGAGIHRKTFYLHYHSLKEMYYQLEDQLFQQLLQAAHHHHVEAGGLSGYNIMEVFNQVITSDPELNQRLITNPSYRFVYQAVLERFGVILKRYIMREFGKPEWQADVTANFVISSIVSAYRSWLEVPGEVTLAELSQLTSTLIRDGVFSILKAKK